jgi:S-adenosylmethionine hydrolase
MTDPHVPLAGQRLAVRRTYGDVAPGEDLALINSFDVLEIARSHGSAADSLGLERGAPVVVQDSVRFR